MAHVSSAVVRIETSGDRAAVSAVIEQAFEAEAAGEGVRVRGLEQALQTAMAPRDRLALVAEHGRQIVGQALLTRGWVDADQRLVQAWVLSPISVRPDHQHTGIGRELLTGVIACATRAAAERPADDPERRVHIFLEGDPGFYRKFGFVPGDRAGFTAPSVRIPPSAFQVLAVAEAPGVSGALVYPDVFWAHDCVGLRRGA
ncbi:GNAT family N-acetyltransferase [Ruania zhangjianzhongii]|uniref:GNAT family N-acetyltransferase n=1 Tax=Ruania zhangjianzhongii TaxID=2603206 RepID=UPI001F27FD03|nr:N-acetyltransferase [Ruania zhangjianzhongii]